MSAAEHEARALREASAGWRDMGRRLEDTVRGLDQEVGRARAEHWRGPAAEAFSGDWTRLRKSVDEALPVFELAAADLDRAADHVEQSADRQDGSVAPAGRAEPLPASYNVAYAFTALSQIGSALGAAFARGRGAGGTFRGRTPLARSAPQPGPQAPHGADPFGPPDTGKTAKEKPTGGLGVAAGRRGPARNGDGDGSGPVPGEQTATEARRDPAPSPASEPQPAADKSTEQHREPHPVRTEGRPAPGDNAPAQPDPRRHGAFG